MDRRTLIITISVLIGLNSAVLADYLGIHLPLIRQVLGFVALTFLPGYLLLKILRTRLESTSERIFMSVALSISIVMFMGIFANFIYPFIGIKRPITLKPLLITFDLIVIFLLIVQQKRSLPIHESWKFKVPKITKWDLFFLFLPFASLLSAYLSSFYGNSRGLLVLYFVISLTPVVFVKVKNFNRTLALWSIAISLMWSTVFGMSWNYIWGFDINGEYHYANVVLVKGIWDISTFSQYNTVASVNILAPVYSLILHIGVVTVFKVIYPLIFSLVPLILVRAYGKFLENKIWAELSVVFIVFFFQFFYNTMALARMMIVEVYLALLVYALIQKINPLFLLIFLASLAVSHYGTAYLTMFALLPLIFIKNRNKNISIPLVGFFWGITLLWYQHTGGGWEFNALVNIGYQTVIMLRDILNPQYSQGLAIIVSRTTLLREIAKWINLFAQFLITVGVLTVGYGILRNKKKKYLEFYIVSLVFFAYDIAGVIVPFFANRMNVNRLYHLTQFFIAPYLLVGFKKIKDIISIFVENRTEWKDTARIAGFFLVVYFVFTSGWILAITGDPNPPAWLKRTDAPAWTIQEIVGAKWIASTRYDDLKIYSDQYRSLLFLGLIGQEINKVSFRGKDTISNFPKDNSYVYLGKVSVREKKILVINQKYLGTMREQRYLSIYESFIFQKFLESDRIYSNPEVWIYKISKT
ncbi:DUF2206 domain-containing protein [Thermococcus sp.]